MLAVTHAGSSTDSPAGLLFWGAVVALIVGLTLCWRGLKAYRRMTAVETIGTSRIASAAVGEVRLSGKVSSAGPLLTAPHTGLPCVYYRLVITERGPADRHERVTTETKSTVFVLDDGSGIVTVFSRGATWDVPASFEHAVALPDPERLTPEQLEVARARLLTVRPPTPIEPEAAPGTSRTYLETRVEVGDTVTVIGSLLPFGDLEDVFEEDTAPEDPVIEAELAEARAAGELAASPEEAWGNAAIPGFGIGRPERTPVLDPEANPMPVVGPDAPDAVDRVAGTVAAGTVEAPSVAEVPSSEPAPGARGRGRTDGIRLEQGTLVVAAGRGHPLAIFAGTPSEAVRRADTEVVVGVAGAVLAILAALAAGVLLANSTWLNGL